MASRILNHLVEKKFKLESGKFGLSYCDLIAIKSECYNGKWGSDIYEIDVDINIDDKINGYISINGDRKIEINDLPIKDFMERYLR